jgi:hypothetical protein
MTYRVVFDGAQQWDWHLPVLFLLVLLPMGALMWLLYRRGRASGVHAAAVVTAYFAVVGLVYCQTHRQLEVARHALEGGEFRIVEGVVDQFHEGIKDESFIVNGVRFEYADGIVVPGFHNEAKNGGPIRQGLHVRIHYAASKIGWGGPYLLRLEIAE